jgi:hypothetical protein
VRSVSGLPLFAKARGCKDYLMYDCEVRTYTKCYVVATCAFVMPRVHLRPSLCRARGVKMRFIAYEVTISQDEWDVKTFFFDCRKAHVQ